MDYKLYRVYIPLTNTCIDRWSNDPEEAYYKAGSPTICEIKEMGEDGKWKTILIIKPVNK